MTGVFPTILGCPPLDLGCSSSKLQTTGFSALRSSELRCCVRYGNKVLQYAIELTEETSKQGATLRRALLEMHVGRAIRPYGCVRI